MFGLTRSPRLPAFAGLLLAALVAASAGAAGGRNPQSDPPYHLPGHYRGTEAIRALGTLMPEVAARYYRSAADLRRGFLQERDLWVDDRTRLYYACSALPDPNKGGVRARGTGDAPPFPESETFKLHSRPGSRKTVYLDFDGHLTSGTSWNNGNDIDSAPWDLDGNGSNWSTAEAEGIQRTWLRMAEDFIPFDVDVTTEDPGVEKLRRTNAGDQDYGIRVVLSPTDGWFGGAGGVAYIGSFNWDSDTPCFVFTANLGNDEKNFAEAGSHEVGHTVGLYHDGQTGGVEYYGGQGNWAPIMGVGYYRPITQWSKGEYDKANNQQDDLAVAANYGCVQMADDRGNNIATAEMLSGTTPKVKGTIERTDDADVFGFVTGNGAITLNAQPAGWGANLDIRLDLLDENGLNLASSDPAGLGASIQITLQPGIYYLRVDGVGAANPVTDGYSDYGSLGEYNLDLTLKVAFPPPTNVRATGVSQTQIDFEWQDNSIGEAEFQIESAPLGGNFTPLATVGANSTRYPHAGLAPNTTVRYRVRAVNDLLISPWSAVATGATLPTPPAAPDNLVVTSVTGTEVQLGWRDNANNETSFEIERLRGTGQFQLVGVTGTNVKVFSDDTVDPGETYRYRVRAKNAGGVSEYSNEVEAVTPLVPPATPVLTNVSNSGADRMLLNWTHDAVLTNGFRIERKTAGTSFAFLTEVGSSTLSYSDPGLAPNTAYTYRVLAFGPGGDSNPSNERTGLTVPLAPDGLTATRGAGEVLLNWTHPGGTDGFVIERRTSSSSFSQIAQVGASTFSFLNTGLAVGTTVTYRVRAFNASGNSSASPTASIGIVPRISTFKVKPGTTTGGSKVKGTITLVTAAPAGGAIIQISGDPTSVKVPASVSIPAGKTTATVPITTKSTRSNKTTQVQAEYGGVAVIAVLKLKK